MKIRSWVIVSVVFGTCGLAAVSAQTPVITVRLEENQIGTIKTAPGITTRLSFLEAPVEIICGDLYDPGSGTGSFVIQRSGNDVFLKPIASKGVSNMFVKAGENGERIYNFDLVIVPAAQAYRIVNVLSTRPTPVATIRQVKSKPTALPVIASILPVSFSPGTAPLGTTVNRWPEDLPPPPPPLVMRPLKNNLAGSLNRNVVKRVPAEYPEMARKTGVYGQVVVEVMIDEKGKVVAAKAVSGPLILRGSAVIAAKYWKFAEATSDGVLSHEIGRITFNFFNPDDRSNTFITLSGGSGASRGRRN